MVVSGRRYARRPHLRPAAIRSGARRRKPKATADTVILLWMAGGMAQTETFDPKRYTPFAPGMRTERRAQHLSRHRHRRRQHQDLARPGAHRQRDGSRHADPHLPGRRPRLHPALAPSVSLAHRLRAAADRRRAAPGRGDRADAGPDAIPTCRPSSTSARISRSAPRARR